MEAEILQKLNESLIRFKIVGSDHGFKNCVFFLDIGKSCRAKTFKDIKKGFNWLAKSPYKHFPNSEFANWWKEQHEKNYERS